MKQHTCRYCNAVNKHFSFQCGLKPLDKKKKRKVLSKKKKKSLAIYRDLRDEYFKNNPICEFDGCNSRELTLHHAKGRIGSNLTDIRYFKSLCLTHHQFVEENPLEAIKMGLSFKRI